MKCLSIKQPWAGLIVLGIKDVENRSWPIRYTGPLLIHASKQVDREAWGTFMGKAWTRRPRDARAVSSIANLSEHGADVDAAFRCGAIVGQATVYQCGMLHYGQDGLLETLYATGPMAGQAPKMFAPQSEWHDHDCWGAYLRDAQMLPQPVPYPGRLGLFEVPEHVIKYTAEVRPGL